jgi:glucosyl-dolichyl phosphate glucuronosyltransferase
VKVSSASVIVCTYNRAHLLRQTLAELCAMDPVPSCATELIVVDNNSTDDTPQVIAQAASLSRIRIVAVRESQQGKGFALNRGLLASTSDVIALTDDDVWVPRDWLSRIVAAFRARDVSFVCGKVLPRWAVVPPPELLMPPAQAVWGPLGLVDYGNQPVDYVPEQDQRLPIGANLAFSHQSLAAIGAWRTDLGRVNNTLISGEDHEIFMRLRRVGLYRGFYDPDLVVRHLVPAERLTRRYFRRWFFWSGKTQALMLDNIFFKLDMQRVPRVLGVPRFIYRQAVRQLFRWLGRVGRRDPLALLIEEARLVQCAGLVTECWRHRANGRRQRTPGRPTWA